MASRNKTTQLGYGVPIEDVAASGDRGTGSDAPKGVVETSATTFAASESRVEHLLCALRNERDEAEQRELAITAQFRKLTYVVIGLSLAVVGTNVALLARGNKPPQVTLSVPAPPPAMVPVPAPPMVVPEAPRPVATEKVVEGSPSVAVVAKPAEKDRVVVAVSKPQRPKRLATPSSPKSPQPRMVHTVANPPSPALMPKVIPQEEVSVIERW